jgi:soluble lytic murein transglycosylase-like protein
MATTGAQSNRLRLGIMFSHNKIWFSELIAGAGVFLALSLFLSVTIIILFNSRAIHSNDRRIGALIAEKITLSYAVEEARREARIVTVLRTFVGKAVPDRTLRQVGGLVSRNSAQFGYDPLLLLAVISVESYFTPNASGRFESGTLSGALGLMQLQFETAKEMARQLKMPSLKEKDLFNPEINLVLGVAFLTQLITQFKSFKLGLLAYNQGPAVIIESLANRGSLSIEYYERVLKNYYRLRRVAAKIER